MPEGEDHLMRLDMCETADCPRVRRVRSKSDVGDQIDVWDRRQGAGAPHREHPRGIPDLMLSGPADEPLIALVMQF